MIDMTEERPYIPMDEVAAALGIVRGTLYHHLRKMGIEQVKFPMDRKAYVSHADLEKLLAAKQAVQDRKREPEEKIKPQLPQVQKTRHHKRKRR